MFRTELLQTKMLPTKMGPRVWTRLVPSKPLTAQSCFAVLLVLGFLVCAPAFAARRADVPLAAPVPPQITAAHKVFISNGGGVSLNDIADVTVFNGGPNRPYNEFYAAMKSWGRYDLVSSPSDADMVLKINFALSSTVFLPKSNDVLGYLRLVVIDPKTHVALWTIVEYVRWAVLLGNRDKNFDRSMNTLVDRFKKLAEPSKAVPTP